MITFCRVGTEVQSTFQTLALTTKGALVDEMRDRLDFKVVSWQQNLPDCLKFSRELLAAPLTTTRGHLRLRLILYLRANQMRIMIHRKSALRFGPYRMLNTSTINTLADIACDTVHILLDLGRSPTGLYQSQQCAFNHFLESSVSTLLLIICRPGPDVDRSSVREVRLAMDLIRNLLPASPIMRRLRERLEAIATNSGYNSINLHLDGRTGAASDETTDATDTADAADAASGRDEVEEQHCVARPQPVPFLPSPPTSELPTGTGHEQDLGLAVADMPWSPPHDYGGFYPFLFPVELTTVLTAGMDNAHHLTGSTPGGMQDDRLAEGQMLGPLNPQPTLPLSNLFSDFNQDLLL